MSKVEILWKKFGAIFPFFLFFLTSLGQIGGGIRESLMFAAVAGFQPFLSAIFFLRRGRYFWVGLLVNGFVPGFVRWQMSRTPLGEEVIYQSGGEILVFGLLYFLTNQIIEGIDSTYKK